MQQARIVRRRLGQNSVAQGRDAPAGAGGLATASALGFDFNPMVFTAKTRYTCFVPAFAFVSV